MELEMKGEKDKSQEKKIGKLMLINGGLSMLKGNSSVVSSIANGARTAMTYLSIPNEEE